MLAHPAPFPLPELARSLSSLPLVGPATVKALATKDLRTLGDALFFLPRRYEDRRFARPICECLYGERIMLKAIITASGSQGRFGKLYKIGLQDDTGTIDCLWFRFNKRHLESFSSGDEVYVVGEVTKDRLNKLQLVHPQIYKVKDVGPDHPFIGRVMPVYSSVEGVRPGSLLRIMAELFKKIGQTLPDPLFGLLPLDFYPFDAFSALNKAHHPDMDFNENDMDPKTADWRKVLAINELFYYELGLALNRRNRSKTKALSLQGPGILAEKFIKSLPFKLTQGQKQAIFTINHDLALTSPMARLLAGDVGTGKTVVAAAASLTAIESKAQVALMAPTEVLARQHMATLRKYLEPLGIKIALAVGSQDAKERKKALKAAAGDADLLVGTHALLSEGVDFKNLGLVIIDEQHRFGVEQRLILTGKGQSPHLLVLSATPIPRTLSLALSGHMDISDLPEKPGKRPPVATYSIEHPKRRIAVNAIAKALAQKEQVYVICPLVEPSEFIDAPCAIDTHRNLSAYFKDASVGLLHGRMDSEEQQEVLNQFRSGKCQLLVATTVVEVGVDVPEATLMVILGAQRFGLSQLHQLRGRVGRGDKPGTCMLVMGEKASELAMRRMSVLCSTNDGLTVAEADLTLRGPGEALGASQAGLPPFKVADWMRDAELTPVLRSYIQNWLEKDPEMQGEQLTVLVKECLRRWGRRLGLTKAG